MSTISDCAYAAQATETMLDAIAGSDGTRASVARRLLAANARRSFVGAVSFDANGDPSKVPIAIYRVDSHAPYDRYRAAQGLVFVRVVEPPRSLLR